MVKRLHATCRATLAAIVPSRSETIPTSGFADRQLGLCYGNWRTLPEPPLVRLCQVGPEVVPGSVGFEVGSSPERLT
jgi:hypothetical protein